MPWAAVAPGGKHRGAPRRCVTTSDYAHRDQRRGSGGAESSSKNEQLKLLRVEGFLQRQGVFSVDFQFVEFTIDHMEKNMHENTVGVGVFGLNRDSLPHFSNKVTSNL